jgi:hypothetical protein
MLKDRRIKIAWRAHLAELGVIQRFERPSETEVADRCRRYFRWRLAEAVEFLSTDSEKLAEILNEILALVIGEDEVENWTPPALEETLSRITEPLASYTDAAHC